MAQTGRNNLSAKLKQKLRNLADAYETPSFMAGDPSQFMHRFTETADAEVVGLLSAALAFGKRSEILSHMEKILAMMEPLSPREWILGGHFQEAFPDSEKSFYRIFSHRQLRLFFETLQNILSRWGTLGECLEAEWRTEGCCRAQGGLAVTLAKLFPAACAPLIPQGANCANKRLNLFLRWMVRGHSPVDLGLWKWYPASELLMPLDTHVVETAKAFGLLSAKATPSLLCALRLTDAMRRVFPDDPLKGDFALFGYGIDANRQSVYKASILKELENHE